MRFKFEDILELFLKVLMLGLIGLSILSIFCIPSCLEKERTKKAHRKEKKEEYLILKTLPARTPEQERKVIAYEMKRQKQLAAEPNKQIADALWANALIRR